MINFAKVWLTLPKDDWLYQSMINFTKVWLTVWLTDGVQFNEKWTKIHMAIWQCGTPRVFI